MQMPGMTDKSAEEMDKEDSTKISMEDSKKAEMGDAAKMDLGDSQKVSPGMGDSPATDLVAQKWDDQKQMLVRLVVRAAPADVDVHYDALLANRRALDDPEIVPVEPGESVLLRLIASSSATNFYVDTGSLEGEILAVDGEGGAADKG
jgi:hypothetical protein